MLITLPLLTAPRIAGLLPATVPLHHGQEQTGFSYTNPALINFDRDVQTQLFNAATQFLDVSIDFLMAPNKVSIHNAVCEFILTLKHIEQPDKPAQHAQSIVMPASYRSIQEMNAELNSLLHEMQREFGAFDHLHSTREYHAG
jgi:hypothetical protein